MALETLKAYETLKEHGLNPYIEIDHDTNTVSFKIQDGPIKEVGENGCQVDDVISVALAMLTGLDAQHPCDENKDAIIRLTEAKLALTRRHIRRVKQNIEGRDLEALHSDQDIFIGLVNDVPARVNVPVDLLVEAGRASAEIMFVVPSHELAVDMYSAPPKAWEAVHKLLGFAHDVSTTKDSAERVRKAQRGE